MLDCEITENPHTLSKFFCPKEEMLYASWGNITNMWAGLLREIFEEPSYDIPLLKENNLTIIDLGANIGVSIDYFNKNGNKVYAIEGSKLLCECLFETQKLNESWKDIEIYNYALSNKNELVEFAFLPKNATGSCKSDTRIPDMHYIYESVEGITFTSLLEKLQLIDKSIDLLKIDIEGSEHFVLDEEFTKLNNIKNIIVETHNDLHVPIFEALKDKYIHTVLRDSGSQKVIWFQNGN